LDLKEDEMTNGLPIGGIPHQHIFTGDPVPSIMRQQPASYSDIQVRLANIETQLSMIMDILVRPQVLVEPALAPAAPTPNIEDEKSQAIWRALKQSAR
jgi:hypothetical protein